MSRKGFLRLWPFALVLALSSATILLTSQGWKERILNDLDKIIFYYQAYGLIHSGWIPDHGQLYSFEAYAPPGVAYLMAPSMLVLKDPRLYELPATALLDVGTILLVCLLGKEVGGIWVGVVSALSLALSRLGHPDILDPQFFVVASVFLGYVWVSKRKAWALPGLLIVLGFGLYVYPKVLPFVLAVPILWVLYRPPVRLRDLGIALIAILLMWFPYLRFEWSRQFIDIRSYVLREPVAAVEGAPSNTPNYCFAALEGESDSKNETYLPYLGLPGVAQRVVYPGPARADVVRYTVCSLLLKIGRNFNNDTLLFGASRFPNAFLLTLFWIAATASVGSGLIRRIRARRFAQRFFGLKMVEALAFAVLGAVVLYVLFSPPLVGKCCTADGKLSHASSLVVEQVQSALPLLWIGLVLGLYLAANTQGNWKGRELLGILVLVPYLILVVVSETARADRFWWIWPMQLLLVSVALDLFAQQTRWPRPIFAGLAAVLILMMINTGFYGQKVNDWLANGYAGKSTGQLETVDFLGSVARQEDSSNMTIGYQLLWPQFNTETTVDPTYRAGTWFDFLLESREGIHNLNSSVEGLTAADEFRVIEIGDGNWPGRPPWPGFELVARFGVFEVFRRTN